MVEGENAERHEEVEEGRAIEVIAGYKVHPLASRFELLVGEDFEKLVEAAARAGRLASVETHNGFLIDGRNRLRVQEELRRRGIEIEVPVVEWEPTGEDTVEEHIWAVNANRRHLTPDQRVVLALEFLPSIQAARQARQEASRFGKNEGDAVASTSTQPDGEAERSPRTSAEKDAASSAGCLAALANVTIYKGRQAISLQSAVEAGEASESEIDEVVAGHKTLAAAIPRRKKGGAKKARPDNWNEADDEELTFDEDLFLNEEAPTCSSLEVDIDRFWQTLTDDIPVTEHRDMCRLLKQKIAAMEQQHSW